MTIECRCISDSLAEMPSEQFLFDSPTVDGHENGIHSVVLTEGNEQRAESLLAAGVGCVLLGECALRDSQVVERLVAKHGGERIGLYVPVRKLAVDWSFETVSNADFKVVTPSICEPTWEILRADGSGTGTHAEWWLGEMLEHGVQTILLRADIRDDTDLNLCAGMVERFAFQLWLAPLHDTDPPLADWLTFGQVRRLALPLALFNRRDKWITPEEPAVVAETLLETS